MAERRIGLKTQQPKDWERNMGESLQTITKRLREALKQRAEAQKAVEGGSNAALPHIARFQLGDIIHDTVGRAKVISRMIEEHNTKPSEVKISVVYEYRRFNKDGSLSGRVSRIYDWSTAWEKVDNEKGRTRKNKALEQGSTGANKKTSRCDRLTIKI